MSKLEEFLGGERPDDVAIFLTRDYLDERGRIADMGEAVDDGVVLVVDGEKGRQAFAAGTGTDAMEFAQGAMGEDGRIDAELGGGECPAAGGEADHPVRFAFAFAEEQNDEVGGLYAEGDVIHAYAQCDCGVSYSDRWVVGER